MAGWTYILHTDPSFRGFNQLAESYPYFLTCSFWWCW